MKFILTFTLILSLCLAQHAQENAKPIIIDTALAKKITVSGFCLCRTSIAELHKLSDDFKKVEVEEMDTPKKMHCT